ncbi:MAG: tRNA uracil 4-sulfurtransferase ThiI [Planctomycetota bacterium]
MLLHVRYDEIALKGGRRGFYEGALAQNIASQLQLPPERVQRSDGRIRIDLGPDTDDPREPLAALQRTFGVAGCAVVHRLSRADGEGAVERDLEAAAELGARLAREQLAQGKRSFKVETRRRDKGYPLTSLQVSREVGSRVHDLAPELIVDVHEPDFTLTVELELSYLYLVSADEPGPRGLPTGTGGKALVLLSGGIDSPVAAWYAFKRGMHASCIHFHAPPGTGPKAKEKVATLARTLSRWTPKALKLYYVRTTELQEAIARGAPEPLRVVLLRRSFARISRLLAKWKGYKCLVGGEALGQVASQTPENLTAVHAAIPDFLYLHPLIGLDKLEICRVAERIGTYQTSIEPHPDCCSLFAPKSPALAATIAECEQAEQGLDLERLEVEATEAREALAFRRGEPIEVRRP